MRKVRQVLPALFNCGCPERPTGKEAHAKPYRNNQGDRKGDKIYVFPGVKEIKHRAKRSRNIKIIVFSEVNSFGVCLSEQGLNLKAESLAFPACDREMSSRSFSAKRSLNSFAYSGGHPSRRAKTLTRIPWSARGGANESKQRVASLSLLSANAAGLFEIFGVDLVCHR